MAWRQANPHGAGFQNCGAVGPWSGHDNVVLIGADTAGIHKSVNRGTLFANRDADITTVDTHIACIEPHPSQAGRFFALTGNGTSGSLLESTDYGDTWADVTGGTANICGDGALAGNTDLLGSGEHPRSVGRLITIDASGSRIYVGTFKHGVYRGTLGATSGVSSWASIGGLTSNFYVRGVVWDATNAALYVSTFNDPGSSVTTAGGHVYRCVNPTAGSPTFTELTGSPMCGSAMLVIGDRLYTVAHPITANLTDKGLWYLDAAHSASAATVWTKVAALPTTTGARWMSLDGYKVGSTTTLWCGCASDGANSLYKLVNTGTGFTGTLYPTAASTVKNDMGGPNTPADSWWMYVYRQSFMLGKPTFVASTIRVNPQNRSEVYVFGRSGAWRTQNDGLTWYPVVKGIGATVTLTAICDPVVQGKVYIGLGDWSILASADSLDNVINAPPPSGSFSYAACIDESTSPATLYTAASPRQDSTSYTSKVYSNVNVLGGGAWVDTGFSAANVIVTGLSVIYSGATRIILATTSAGVLWRKSGAGAWAIIAAAAMTPSGGLGLTGTDTTPFARNITRTATYLYDRSVGVWRSTNGGANWTRIWAHASSNSDQAGWVAVHPTNPAILYVSDQTSVYKITDADSCLTDAATHVTIGNAIGARGPMAVDPVNNKIGVCDITATPRWWESDLATIAWVDKSDQLYQNAVAAPQWASYDRSGAVVIALSGNGAIMSTPAVANQPPAATITAPAASQVFAAGTTSITLSGTATDDAVGVTAAYSLDGAASVSLALTAGAYSQSVTVAAGSHTIIVTATDTAGLTNSKTVAFSVTAVTPPADTTPPTLAVATPSADGDVANATTTQTVAGTASDNVALASLTVNGTLVTVSGGSYSTSVPLAVGSNLITVVATDTASPANRTTVTRTITRAAPDPVSPPFFTTRPSITGSPIAGNTLTGVDGAVTGAPTPTLGSRVWRKTDGTSVGTGSTFLVPSSTLDGETLTYEVVATNSQGAVTGTSLATAAVSTPVNPPIWTVAPSISGQTGSGQSGDVLAGASGTFSPGSLSSRKWQSSPTGAPGTEADIASATSASFTVTDTQVGGYVRYYVDAANSGVHNTNTSAWLGPIAPAPSTDVAPSNLAAPTITSGSQVGEVLLLNVGTWDGSPTPAITQQWYRVTAGVEAAIAPQTGLSYTLAVGDVGSRVMCRVTATNSVTAVSEDSNLTGQVSAAPVPISQQVQQISDDLNALSAQIAERGL